MPMCHPLAILFIALLDVLLSTVLYLHGGSYHYHFAVDFVQFRIETSMLELWLFSVIRTSVVTGGALGMMRHPDAVSRSRIHKSRIAVFVTALLMWTYTIIKLLMYSEQHAPGWKRSWFWLLFAWTLIAIVLFYVNWTLLAKFVRPSHKVLVVNSSDEERQSLLATEEEEKDEKKTEPSIRKKSSNIFRLLTYTKPDLHLLIPASLFLVASSTAQIFTPYYTGQVIQSIAIEKNQHKFVVAIIYMAAFSVASAVCAGLRGCCFKIAMARLNIRIRNELFLSIVQQEVGFFDTIKTGDITSRLTADTQSISDSLTLNCNIFLRSLIKAVGVCVFMFKLSWRLSLVTLVGIPMIMAVSKVYGSYYEALSKSVQDSLAEANAVAEETCSSLRTVRSFANELAESARYAQKLLITYGLKKKESYAYAGYVWCNEIFALSLIVASLYYGGHLVVTNFITGGHLISFILYQFELSFALESMGDVYTGLMQAVGASEKVFEFIDRQPLINPSGGDYCPDKMAGKVEFQNVTFAYPSRPDSVVLHNVSFKVQPGEVVALVGPSGGGKSSCVNLLEHFYETQQGDVLIDDVPISSYDHKYLHNQISLVGQEPVLYACSIRDNIAYGLESCDFTTVEKAARMANAHQFITEMKEGYDATTGEKGTQLSGGQKQRVAIARAVVRNPSILLLDEATSALDSESEYLVQQALYNNLKGRTVIIIAHRLSTVEKANRIIVIEKGRVVEQGSHAELLSKGNAGLYSRLVQRQLLGFDVGFTNHVTKAPPETVQSNESFKSMPSESPPTRYGSFC